MHSMENKLIQRFDQIKVLSYHQVIPSRAVSDTEKNLYDRERAVLCFRISREQSVKES